MKIIVHNHGHGVDAVAAPDLAVPEGAHYGMDLDHDPEDLAEIARFVDFEPYKGEWVDVLSVDVGGPGETAGPAGPRAHDAVGVYTAEGRYPFVGVRVGDRLLELTTAAEVDQFVGAVTSCAGEAGLP